MMQETVTNSKERKSLFSSFLEVLEARDKQAQLDRQLQEEKYLRRTQRIYEFHDRQRREAAELRRCLDYVTRHAHVLESVLRGASGAGDGSDGSDGSVVPLSVTLVRQAAALQRCMLQCVANASRIRDLLTASHQSQMDTLLAKMESELSTWTSFLQRVADASYNSETVLDNLHNMIAEQRRCVRELSASNVFMSLCEPSGALATAGAGAETSAGAGADEEANSTLEQRAPSAVCSTPIAKN